MTHESKKKWLARTMKAGLWVTAVVARAAIFLLWGAGKYRQFRWESLTLSADVAGTRQCAILAPNAASDRFVAEVDAALRRNETGGEALDRLRNE